MECYVNVMVLFNPIIKHVIVEDIYTGGLRHKLRAMFMFVGNSLKGRLVNQGIVATMSSDAEILKELVGCEYMLLGFLCQGQVEKVGENWMVAIDKRGFRYYVNLKKHYSLQVKAK